MTVRSCFPLCAICLAPGPSVCAEQARFESDERYFEALDAHSDKVRAERWADRLPSPFGLSVTHRGWDSFGRPVSASGDRP